MESTIADIPSVVNGERIYNGRKSSQTNPWNRNGPPLAEYHEVDRDTVMKKAIPGALQARKKWANMPFSHRAAIYKRAAKLVESKYRWKLMAATMTGQGKTCGQAEGDCIAEVIDTISTSTSTTVTSFTSSSRATNQTRQTIVSTIHH